MVKVSDVYTGGKWLKSEALWIEAEKRYAEAKVVIEQAYLGEVGTGDDVKQQIILKFESRDSQLGLNKTNASMLEAHFGDDSDTWIGKEVILWVDPFVSYQGRQVPGIRIKIPGTVEEHDVPF